MTNQVELDREADALTQIARALRSITTRGGLSDAYALVRAHDKLQRNEVVRTNAATLKTGDHAILQNLRPARLNGREVVILEVRRTKASVQEIDSSVRPGASSIPWNPSYLVPLACLRAKD